MWKTPWAYLKRIELKVTDLEAMHLVAVETVVVLSERWKTVQKCGRGDWTTAQVIQLV
jgi:hypothetical protein